MDAIAELAAHGVSFEAAWDMPPTLSDRILAVARARSIDPRHRVGGALMGTREQLTGLLGI